MPDWVEQVCAIASLHKTRRHDVPLTQLFAPAEPALADRDEFVAAVTAWLERHPQLVDDWDVYCIDRRSTAAPYFDPGYDGSDSGDDTTPTVGFYSAERGYEDVTDYRSAVEACANYVYREAHWVLHHQQIR